MLSQRACVGEPIPMKTAENKAYFWAYDSANLATMQVKMATVQRLKENQHFGRENIGNWGWASIFEQLLGSTMALKIKSVSNSACLFSLSSV